MKSNESVSTSDSSVRPSEKKQKVDSSATHKEDLDQQRLVSAKDVDVLCGRGKPSFNHGKSLFMFVSL